MSFWNPARMEETKQNQLDKRVILGMAKEKLIKDLQKVNKKIEADNKKWSRIDVFSISRKQRASMNTRRDNLAFERNEVQRRLDLIENELQKM